jgi:hypothetical protein
VNALFELLPPGAWVALCLAIAAVYAWLWPRRKAEAARIASGFRFLVLRWFHSLVWLLLAIAVAVRSQPGKVPYLTASVIAILAFAVYVTFLVISYLIDRRISQQPEQG